MGTPSTTALVSATDQLAARATDRSAVVEVMADVRAWFQFKPAVELAQIIGCDVRTAERYFAGDRTPEFLATVKMLAHPGLGIAMVEAASRRLPPAEHKRFQIELAKAALRALVRETNGSE